MNQPQRVAVYPVKSSPLSIVGVLVFAVFVFSAIFSALGMVAWVSAQLFGGH